MTPVTAPQRAYHRFVIQYSALPAEPNRYTARITGTLLNGQLGSDEQETRSFDPALFKVDDGGIEVDLLEKLSARTIERPQLFQLGRLLSDIFLPGSIRRRLQEDLIVARERGLSIRLHLDIRANVLRGLPCEYLYLPDGSIPEEDKLNFLALNPMFSIVRDLGIDTAEAARATQTRFRMVAAFASPPQQPALNLAADRSALERMTHAEGAGRFDVDYLDKATLDDLLAALRAPADVFHFSGHGAFDGEKGQIILEGGDYGSYYDAEPLASLLRDARVRLAVLSACQTGQLSGENVWGAVASELQRAGVAAVVASQFRLRDANANVLTATLYRELLAGATVDEAIYRTRQAIDQKSGGDDRDWGAIVLYARRGTDVIFQPRLAGERYADQPSMKQTVPPQAAQVAPSIPPIAMPAVTVDKDILRAYFRDDYARNGLDDLCAGIQQTLEDRGITVEITMEMIAGSEVSQKVSNLVEWLDERGYLDALVTVLIGAYKDFMVEAFDDEQLLEFCRTHFPEVFALFRAGQSKSNHLEQLLTYVAQHNQYLEIVAALRDERPDAYDEYEDQLTRLDRRAQMDLARSALPAGKPLTETNVAQLKVAAVLADHQDQVLSVAFSRDGKLLATASGDARVRIWDTATGKLVRTLTDHRAPVNCVAFSPHGLPLIASGSQDETICVWETATYQRLYQWKAQFGGVSALAFSPDGALLVTAAGNPNARVSTLWWWDVVHGKGVHSVNVTDGYITCLAHHPAGPAGQPQPSIVAAGLANLFDSVGLYSKDKSAALKRVLSHDAAVRAVAYSPDGKLLVSGSDDKTLRFLDSALPDQVKIWSGYAPVTGLAFSADGLLLAAARLGNSVAITRVDDPTTRGDLDRHVAIVTTVAFSPDGRTIATGSADRTARLWRVR